MITEFQEKSWSLEFLFEILGMLVSHSLLQGGPGLRCLSPAVFSYLASGNSAYCFPVKEDIPLDISTHMLISFIEKVTIILYMNPMLVGICM